MFTRIWHRLKCRLELHEWGLVVDESQRIWWRCRHCARINRGGQ